MTKSAHLRASDADRDQIVDRLHRASTEGRIAAEELEHRVSRALKARTYGELDATVADLPGPGRARSRGGSAPARRATAGWALTVARRHPLLVLLAVPALAVTTAMVLAATVVWLTLMAVVMILGGRGRAPAPPWVQVRRHRAYRPPPPAPPHAPRSYWA